MAVESLGLSVLSWRWGRRVPIAAKIGVLMHVASDVTSFYFPSTLPPFILLTDNDNSCYSIEKVLGQY